MRTTLIAVVLLGGALIGWNVWQVRHPVPYVPPVADGWGENYAVWENVLVSGKQYVTCTTSQREVTCQFYPPMPKGQMYLISIASDGENNWIAGMAEYTNVKGGQP